MIKNPMMAIWLAFAPCILAQTQEQSVLKTGFGRPARIAVSDLANFDSLPADRRKLIERALAVASDSPWLPYTARGTSPEDGGFDCSGAMYFVMRGAGLDPPRTAAAQLQWIIRSGRLQEVPADTVDMDHPRLKGLHPGDLLFWGKSDSMASGMVPEITHVAMFLGMEKSDHRPVMINSTDGRSYRGIKANGYGVYDFRLPPAGARIAFIGYGSPPGISAMD